MEIDVSEDDLHEILRALQLKMKILEVIGLQEYYTRIRSLWEKLLRFLG